MSTDAILEDLRTRAAMGVAVTMGAPASDPLRADQVLVRDEWLSNPMVYRSWALGRLFGDVTIGAATFQGIGQIPQHETALQWWRAALEERGIGGLDPTLTFFRQSPAQQQEPNFIHTDRDLGDWAGVLYLTPNPPAGDGTTFWRHRVTGAVASAADGADLLAEWMTWRDRDQWDPWQTVFAQFNRLVLWPASYFHSRALVENYGEGETARLIQVVSGRGVLRCQ